MPAGIEISNYVQNQKGSPALYSDTLANRPAPSFIGRLFISIDTLEIYRDTGSAWDLIGGGGGPAVNIYNSDGSLTGTRVMNMAGYDLTFEGGASTSKIDISANNNVSRIISFSTAGVDRWSIITEDNETGGNTGANWYLKAFDDIGSYTFSPLIVERRTGEKSFIANETLSASTQNLTGTYNLTTATINAGIGLTGGNPQSAEHNNYTVINNGSYTVAASMFFGAQSNVLRLTSAANGTATFTQASPGLRVAAANLNQVQFNTSNGSAINYSHVAVSQNLGIYRLSVSGSLTVTNAYNLLLNDLNEYSYTNLTITNRWGIYQDSITDVNYFGGTTLVGKTTNNGAKFQVQGEIKINDATSTIGINNSGGVGTIGTTSNHRFSIITNNVARWHFQASGNLSWGTTTDFGTPLYLTGSALTFINLRGTSSNSWIQYGTSSGSNAVLAGAEFTDYVIYLNGFKALQLYRNGYSLGLLRATILPTGISGQFQMYNDFVGGVNVPHFVASNGTVTKIYQETTAVGSATIVSPGAGSVIKTDDTFDGYTLQQVVQALRNFGLLQ